MAKYQLTISADDPAELADILNGTGCAALSDDPGEVLTRLQELMDAEGKTVVVRAKRNSRGSSKSDSGEKAPKENAKSDEAKNEAEDTEAENETENEDAEAEAEDEPSGPQGDYDFDTVFDTVMEAVKDQSNPERSAKVRKAVSAVAANMDGVKKLSDITDHDQQVQFVESMVSSLPELFGGEDEDTTDPDAEDVFS